MKKRRSRFRLLVVIVAALTVCVTLFAVLAEREPLVKGRPIGDWFDQISGTNAQEAASALREADATTVPFLINKVRNRTSRFDGAYTATWNKLPAWAQKRLPAPTVTVVERAQAGSLFHVAV